MEGRTRHFSLWSGKVVVSLVVLLSLGSMGCGIQLTHPEPTYLDTIVKTVDEGGWLIGRQHAVVFYTKHGLDESEWDFSDSKTVQGVLMRPATREPIVIVQEGETWVVLLLQAGKWTTVYSSKVAFSSCDLAPNGHALLCVQAGDLNLIRLEDQRVQRLDSGVQDAVWSPTNTDVLVSYADHADLLGLDLDDQVATRTVLTTQAISGQQFVDSGQAVWWTGDEVQRQLQLYSLRSAETTTLWTGVAAPQVWVEQKGNRLAVSDNRTCDPTCTTTILTLPGGASLQTADGVFPVGWNTNDLITAAPLKPIDQEPRQRYHFSTLSADQTVTDFGDGLFLATDHLYHLSFTQ